MTNPQTDGPPTAENEVFRASLCGTADFIEKIGDLDALKAEVATRFPADKIVVIQSDQTIDAGGNRTRRRYRGSPRGRLVSRRYPSGDSFVWREM